jgi:hypothetical protein
LLAIDIQNKLVAPKNMLADFKTALEGRSAEVAELRKEVNNLATSFPMPGFNVSELKYGKDGTKL